jgi:hypothetical protein
MALASGILETGVRASTTHGHVLVTRETSYMPKLANPFLIFEAGGPMRVTGHVAALKPSRARRQGPESWGM